MKRDYRRWFSPHLGREMEMLVFGHAGARVLMFPTRDGRFYEYEDLGVVASLTDKIEAGQLQLYCIEGLAQESLYDLGREPSERLRRQAALEAYILGEVVPLMAHLNPYDCTIAAGCSLGAYQAASLVLRHPQRFAKLAAFSGRFDLTMKVECFDDLFSGHYDDAVHRHTPTHFLCDDDAPDRLAALRALDIVLAVGAEDPFLENNRHLCRLLDQKAIPYRLHIWEGRAHSAGAWRRMAPLYI